MKNHTILITNILALLCLIIGIWNFNLLVPAFLVVILLWRVQKNYKELEKLKNK